MMLEKIGEPAMLEQLAEEAAELSHAALKLARIIRGENPTPVTEVEAWENVIEEFTDVSMCAFELEVNANMDVWDAKAQRFRERWVEKTDSSKEGFGDPDIKRP